MRQEPEFFGELELVLVYMARRLKDALALEKVLDAGGFDYAVIPAPFASGLLFPFQRVGAFFYVAPESQENVVQFMREHGFKPLRPDRGPSGEGSGGTFSNP
jgi:hypothetical protein